MFRKIAVQIIVLSRFRLHSTVHFVQICWYIRIIWDYWAVYMVRYDHICLGSHDCKIILYDFLQKNRLNNPYNFTKKQKITPPELQIDVVYKKKINSNTIGNKNVVAYCVRIDFFGPVDAEDFFKFKIKLFVYLK